jgi:hypothetical protein
MGGVQDHQRSLLTRDAVARLPSLDYVLTPRAALGAGAHLMNHRIWFTLVIRAIGILLIGISGVYLPGYVQYVVSASIENWSSDRLGAIISAIVSMQTLQWLGTFAQAGFGIYLLFGGSWLIDRCLLDAGVEQPSAAPQSGAAPTPKQ